MTRRSGLDAHLVVRRDDDFTLDLPLRIPAGRTVALLGPNGAGKSTAVAALAGLLRIDSGHVRLGGRTLDDPARGLIGRRSTDASGSSSRTTCSFRT